MTKNKFDFFNSIFPHVFPHVFPQKNKGFFMIKPLLIFFSFFNPSFAQEGCVHHFGTDFNIPGEANLEKLNETYSSQLDSVLKTQLQKSNFLSRSEKRELLRALDETSHLIRHQDTNSEHQIQKNARFKSFEPKLLKAIEKVPDILTFLENHNNPYLDQKLAVRIIFATLTKHVKIYLSHPSKISEIDFSRFEVILSSIGNFNDSSFSIYSIIRVVKAKYSAYEYLNCT